MLDPVGGRPLRRILIRAYVKSGREGAPFPVRTTTRIESSPAIRSSVAASSVMIAFVKAFSFSGRAIVSVATASFVSQLNKDGGHDGSSGNSRSRHRRSIAAGWRR